MKSFAYLTVFLLLAFTVQAQQMKSKLALRTYFDQNTGEAKKTDTSFLATYDINGNVLLSNDVEGVCYQSFEYDEKSRMIGEKSFCGETSSECQTVFEEKKEIKTCSNSYGNIITYSDFDDEGRVLHSVLVLENQVLDVDDSIMVEKIHHYYSYDKDGRMLSMESRNQDEKMYSLSKWKYHLNGKLEKHTVFSEKMNPNDSAIYSYDEFQRLTEFRRYTFMNKDRSYGSVLEVLIKYSEKEADKSIRQTNDTLIRHHLSYTFHTFAAMPASMPAQIFFSSCSKDPENPWSEEITLRFNYDEKNRLTSIDESKKKHNGTVTESKKEISYENSEAVLKYKAKNYMGSWVTGMVYTYENDRMKKITENTEHGFPYSELKYFYEFYK